MIVIRAVADFWGSLKLVAVTVAVAFADTEGAVYRPESDIVPWVADHLTDLLLAFPTIATNCRE